MADDGTITRDELRAAIDRLGWYMQRGPDGEAATHPAARIFADVAAHREPDYEPGAVYESPGGGHVRRTDDGMWEEFGTEGKFSHGWPERPLCRMVREGSQSAGLDHGQVLAEITQWTNLGRSEAMDLAWRICKLAGGECSD